MKLPDAYQEIISPYIAKTRGLSESGEIFSATAFAGNFSTKEMVKVVLDSHDDASKTAHHSLFKCPPKALMLISFVLRWRLGAEEKIRSPLQRDLGRIWLNRKLPLS